MTDIARHFRFEGQPPVMRLIFSFCIVVVAGTLFFWIFIWAGSFIFHTTPAGMIKLPGSNITDFEGGVLRYVQFSQQIGIFMLPSFMLLWFMKSDFVPSSWLYNSPALTAGILVFVLGLSMIPFLGFTAGINEKMVLPGSLSGIQGWMKDKENAASDLTKVLISSDNIPGLLLNLMLLAIIPAFCEELLFRGVFQRIFIDLFRNHHLGVWITAIIFSSIHLQFFGFLPRLILGLVFGYLFYWSGNIWYPVMAHFINNAVPVVSAYLSGTGIPEPGSAGGQGYIIFPALSLIISAVVLFCFRKESSRESPVSGDFS